LYLLDEHAWEFSVLLQGRIIITLSFTMATKGYFSRSSVMMGSYSSKLSYHTFLMIEFSSGSGGGSSWLEGGGLSSWNP
jgi:hypothetical protein